MAVINFWIFEMLHTNINFKIKIIFFINIKPIFLKLWIFTDFDKVFAVEVLVFDFKEFSKEGC
jgi:hypothetical protein